MHNIIQVGLVKYDKLPGEWYGPSTIAFVLRDLANAHCELNGTMMAVAVAQSDIISIDDIDALCTTKEWKLNIVNEQLSSGEKSDDVGRKENSSAFYDPLLNRPPSPPKRVSAEERAETVPRPTDWDQSLLLLIPLKLGLDKINPDATTTILRFLEFPQCTGFIGGRPNHAIYFFGHQGDRVFGLDPHTTQSAVGDEDDFPTINFLKTIQASNPRCLSMDKVDPSLALGFYFRTKQEFDTWKSRVQKMRAQGWYMPFAIQRRSLMDEMGQSSDSFSVGEINDEHDKADEDDDFVLIE